MPQRALAAFQRLLADAAVGGPSKVDALVAMSQRTLFVPTWSPGSDAYRTLVSADGTSALAVFSAEDQLREAAHRFGWSMPDGQIPFREVGARAALTHAIDNNLMLVVDVASSHALEVLPAEMRPLLTPAARRDSSGPFATAGRISQTLAAAVRPNPGSVPPPPPSGSSEIPPVLRKSTPVPANPATRSSSPAPTSPATRSSLPPPSTTRSSRAPRPTSEFEEGRPTEGLRRGSSTFAAPTRIGAMNPGPPDDLVEAIRVVLRSYPEVEWACAALIIHGSEAGIPTIAVRVDPTYRARKDELLGKVRETCSNYGTQIAVTGMDDPTLLKAARQSAYMFYPWKR